MHGANAIHVPGNDSHAGILAGATIVHMPVIRIEYEPDVNEDEIKLIAEAMPEIAVEASGRPLEEQSVYVRVNAYTINAAPIELYVEAGPLAIPEGDKEKMLDTVSNRLAELKAEKRIRTPITVSIVEMNWKVRVGI